MKTKVVSTFIIVSVAGILMTACGRKPQAVTLDNVMLYYISGFNNLSRHIDMNLDELCSGEIPEKDSKNALVTFAHFTKNNSGDYKTPNAPCLVKIYREEGHVVFDTLKVYPAETVDASAQTLNNVLNTLRTQLPADHYGMVFSSHGSGWLPSCYYDKATPAVEPKSVGSQFNETPSSRYEIEITDFASAIPMKLDYILFDACLMGGIEVAYELKDVCDYLIISPTEIFDSGFYYQTLAHYMLHDNPDYKKVCEEYFSHSEYGATYAWIDCSGVEAIAQAVKPVIAAHRKDIAKVNPNDVQPLYTGDHAWFFDMMDIFRKAGADADELASIQNALEPSCIKAKGYTPEFGKGTSYYVHISTFCGLSMYLPQEKFSELNAPYRNLAWNKAVGLVE